MCIFVTNSVFELKIRCDVKTNSIERMNVDGSQRTLLFKDAEYEPISVAFHNGVVFWADKKKGTIHRFPVNSHTVKTASKSR